MPRRSGLAALAAVLLMLALGGSASSYAPLPLPAFVVSGGASGGTVEAVAVSATTAYLGGDFGYMGPETGSFVSLDSSSGALTPGWPVVGGSVYAVAADGQGGWFVGGAFASIGGRHADNLAHVAPDGSLDTGFAASTDGPVYTLARSGTTLFAGGFFDTASGQPRARLAGFDTATGAATAFNPGVTGTEPIVSTLELSGSTLYVGGSFAGLGGAPRQNLGAVDTSGVVEPWDPQADAFVNTIAAGPNDTVYVGGFFDRVNGIVGRPRAAAFDADGIGAVKDWNPVPNAEVYAIEVSGSTVYLGGAFTSVTGQARASLAAVDATTGIAQGWTADVTGAVYQLAVVGGTVFAGGSFQKVGDDLTGYDNVAAFSAATGAPTSFSPTVGGDVFALGVSGSKVVAGGAFRTAGTEPVRRDNLAALDLGTGDVTPWSPATDDTVFALGLSGSTVYAGGAFTAANGGTARSGLASFEAETGAVTGWQPNVNGVVFALKLLGSNVYAGGNFTRANGGGVVRNRLAAFAATGPGTALPSWNPNANGTVFALDAVDDTLYAGGDFTSVSANARAHLASFDQGGSLTTWNPTANNTVYALAHVGSTVYAGGLFTSVNSGLPRAAAAAFDANGAATPWNPRLMTGPSTAGVVYALAATPSTLYVGGIFDTTGDCASSCFAANGLAALSASDGSALTSWQPASNGIVNAVAVAVTGAGLVAGGSFTALGYPQAGVPYETVEPDVTYRGGLALLPALPDAPTFAAGAPGDGSVDVTFQQPPLRGGTLVSYTVTAQPGGATTTGTGTEYSFSGLDNGTPYTFSITATTTIGTGPPAVVVATPRTLPGAPTGVAGTGGEHSATVSFTPPAFDGGAPITSYVVRASPGPRSATGTTSPITVNGLENDADYTFTVSAVNDAGEGPASAPSDPVTPHEGGRKHHSAPPPVPRPEVPAPPASTTRPPPPHS